MQDIDISTDGLVVHDAQDVERVERIQARFPKLPSVPKLHHGRGSTISFRHPAAVTTQYHAESLQSGVPLGVPLGIPLECRAVYRGR